MNARLGSPRKSWSLAPVLAGMVLIGGSCSAVSMPDGFVALPPERCTALASSEVVIELPPSWKKYSRAVRVCPLSMRADEKAEVHLLSIFAEDYYRDLPADARWEDFPRPLLINDKGECLAQLPELFPFDEPRDIVIRYGRWKNRRPGEIRIHARNPALGGDYHLPPLRWQPMRQRYEATARADSNYRERIQCPNHHPQP